MSDASEPIGRPRDLGDGLVLRWATPEDTEPLAEFNARIHSDKPDQPDTSLGHWTRDLMSGRHPTTGPGDFTVVVDERADGKVVSTLCLISQTWTYDGIPFGCGRVELVGTDADYRRRGLVRLQMDVVHALSAERDEPVQVITGIPWYYRRFGYEMVLDHGGGHVYSWQRPGNLVPVDEEPFRLRRATADDIPVLARLYEAHCAGDLVLRPRDDALWRYELTGQHEESPYARNLHVIETTDGDVVGYSGFRSWGQVMVVRELGVLPGQPWRPVCLFLARALKAVADHTSEGREKAIEVLSLDLGTQHPAYVALGPQIEKPKPPYAWYVRVADVPGFLRHIGPALERRLAETVMAGHTGTLRLSFYGDQLTLVFDRGRLVEVGTFEPKTVADGDALFPDLTFLKLLFGHRSRQELHDARADSLARGAEAVVLLDALFPKRHSNVVGLG